MTKESKNIAKIVNTPLGSLIHVGEKKVENIKITYTKYNNLELERKEINDLSKFINDTDDKVKWLDIIGIHDTNLVNKICQSLKVHPLVIEDILNTSQNPKMEDYDDYIFLVTKLMYFNEEEELETEQISFILFKDKLISFQELETELFDGILCRLKEGTNIRKNGADDLLYGLLDAIVDNYFLIVEDIGEKIDTIEDELLLNPKKEILQKIYILKRDLIYIRNSLWPMRNVISSLSKNDYDLIDGKTIYYLRDVYDHVIQMIDIIETYRDICSGMLDTYLSSIGNKTNEVMKVLTIFSTIFIPLTFLAGVYGMNFRYLPELNWKYGYFSFWIISIIIIILMLRFFRKKDWL
ncbi:magnesium/cobalt transporter CorA [Tissierella carlieri]|uniref:Magnesium transport protein CorA n=1 Tax=Tissierella carlieri TaxID=689904 RepID=A0ABT1SAD3_9FIRM|nr:magnesium/cobalt transporter CorA [Tissierella carlieri]MCQ4923414.1 magnesium/cobalt transporter CorA [Tissierella carlieri]